MQTTSTKITRATFKSFINKNPDLFIKNNSNFDSMVDCVMPVKSRFTRVQSTDHNVKYTLGIQGAWLVGQSRDWFTHYEDDKFIGIEVSNCCGDFVVVACKECQNEQKEYGVHFCADCYYNFGGKEIDDIERNK
jgi:hypothetical protein